MRYIVTGGAGFIGSNLADTLAQHHDVVIIDNLATGRRVNIEHLLDHPRVTFIEGSITDLDLLMEVFPGADVDPVRSPDAPPGLSRDLAGVLYGADAVVVFAGHKEYRGLVPGEVKGLCGSPHPAVVDGRNVVNPDAWIRAKFVHRGIGRGNKNQ